MNELHILIRNVIALFNQCREFPCRENYEMLNIHRKHLQSHIDAEVPKPIEPFKIKESFMGITGIANGKLSTWYYKEHGDQWNEKLDTRKYFTDEQVRFLLDAPLVLDREMEDIDRACIMRMSDWIVHVKDGTFINYDGHAHYCDGVHISRHYVYPSDYLAGYMDTSIPHICWYNK